MTMYLGSTSASIRDMLASLPVTHTGRMDVYQSTSAVVRVELDAWNYTTVRVDVDSTLTADGRKVLTVRGMA